MENIYGKNCSWIIFWLKKREKRQNVKYINTKKHVQIVTWKIRIIRFVIDSIFGWNTRLFRLKDSTKAKNNYEADKRIEETECTQRKETSHLSSSNFCTELLKVVYGETLL